MFTSLKYVYKSVKRWRFLLYFDASRSTVLSKNLVIVMVSWWWKIKLFTKNTFLRKVTVVFFQKSHFWRMFAGYLYIHLRECLILAGYIKLGCEPLALYSLLGWKHVIKEEKDKNLEPSRRESSRRMSWISNGYSGAVIPNILGSFSIQVTNLSSPIYWGDFSWKGLS